MKHKLYTTLCVALGVCYTGLCQSSISFFGNTHVSGNTALIVNSYDMNFYGTVTTQRAYPYGIITFINSTANDEAGSVDGYMRTAEIGEKYYPLSFGSLLTPINVTTTNTNTVDIVFNNTNINSSSLGSTLEAVSDVGYWQILNYEASQIRLHWFPDNLDMINTMITNLSDLTIAGWNGTQWEAIPSTLITGATLTSGYINTSTSLNASQYYKFTFGRKSDNLSVAAIAPEEVFLLIKDEKLQVSTSETVASLSIYNMLGQHLQTYTPGNNRFATEFVYPKSTYIITVNFENGQTVSKKIIN